MSLKQEILNELKVMLNEASPTDLSPQNKKCPPGTKFSAIELSGPGGDKFVPPHAAYIENGKTVGQCLCPDGKIPNTNLSCNRSSGATPPEQKPTPPSSGGCKNPNNIGINGKRGPSQDIQTIQEILADYFSRMGGSLDTVNFKFAGKADKYGMFGPATEAAVLNYQKRNGLGNDGCVGRKTACSLLKEIFTSKTYTVRSILGLTKKKCQEGGGGSKKTPTPSPTPGPSEPGDPILKMIEDLDAKWLRYVKGVEGKTQRPGSIKDAYRGNPDFKERLKSLNDAGQLNSEKIISVYNTEIGPQGVQYPKEALTYTGVKRESKNWLDRTREETTSNLFERLVKDASKKVL